MSDLQNPEPISQTPRIKTGLVFLLCSGASLLMGLFGGVALGLLAGVGPDYTGGTLYFLCGAILTGVASSMARLLTKRRAVLYGVSFFMWTTSILLILDAVTGTD